MARGPELFRVTRGSSDSERVSEVNFAELGLQEQRDIENWVAANPSILGEDLLIVGRQFKGFDLTRETPDLLAVDSSGNLVIIELKRDDSGADVHWQAIKDASYLDRATPEDIVAMLVKYASVSEEEAADLLLEHMGAEDFTHFNKGQRIVLASHRFAPEVTSAALWLNSKAPGEDLITCVTLTPFRDAETDSLYIQANTIIPVPVVEDYLINIGARSQGAEARVATGLGVKLRTTFERNKNDEVSAFARTVRDLTLKGLDEDIRPDRSQRWAGQGRGLRYYGFWYSRGPWAHSERNNRLCYYMHLRPQEDSDEWHASTLLVDEQARVIPLLNDIELPSGGRIDSDKVHVTIGVEAFSEHFAGQIAEGLRALIEQITPIVDGMADMDNEEEVP